MDKPEQSTTKIEDRASERRTSQGSAHDADNAVSEPQRGYSRHNVTEAVKLEDYYTYEDYCAWDDSERWELIDGTAYAMASPTVEHQRIILEIGGQLREQLKGKQCKPFTAPLDVRLNADGADDTVVQPDILVVCDEEKLKDGKSVVGAPDFIAEILSPSTSGYDVVQKKRLYQRSGVREYWTVDPSNKTVTANVLSEFGYISNGYDEEDAAVPIEALPGCAINLAEVFGV